MKLIVNSLKVHSEAWINRNFVFTGPPRSSNFIQTTKKKLHFNSKACGQHR